MQDIKRQIIQITEVEGKDLLPITIVLKNTESATAANYGVFFTALRPCEVSEIAETHRTAGSDAGAVTLNIENLKSGVALDSGSTVCKTGFSLKSTANTPIIKKGFADLQNRVLDVGDRLALKDTGTLTAVNDVSVTVLLMPVGKGNYR